MDLKTADDHKWGGGLEMATETPSVLALVSFQYLFHWANSHVVYLMWLLRRTCTII